MGEEVTRDLFARGPADPFTPSIARSIKPLREPPNPVRRGRKKVVTALDKPRNENFEMKKAGVSRNHILADSRIRVILEKIAADPKKARALQSDGPKRKALVNFFEALSGKEPGTKQAESFIEALRTKNTARRKLAIDAVAEGRENLKLGNAPVNTAISNEFDPVIVDGRLDPRSMKIRDATIALGAKGVGLIGPRRIWSTLSVTKDRFTHQDVSSSVISSRNNKTETRTVIDHFAGPANPFRHTRSRSIDLGSLGDKSRLSSNVRWPEVVPSREFHHLSRPGVREIE